MDFMNRRTPQAIGIRKKGAGMKEKFSAAQVFLCILFFMICGDAAAREDEDWQFWQATSVDKEWKDAWSFQIEEQKRFGRDMGTYIYQHVDAGLTCAVTEWLTVGGNARYLKRLKNEEWEQEVRPHLNLTVQGQWRQLSFANRNRIEHRMLDDTKDLQRYRNKSTLAWEPEGLPWEISPFIAHEVFLDLDAPEFNFNRSSGGWEFQLVEHLESRLYYLYQDANDRGTESAAHVLGLDVGFEF